MIGLIQTLGVVFVGVVASVSVLIEGIERWSGFDWDDDRIEGRRRRAWMLALAPWLAGATSVLVILMPGILDELGLIVGHCHLPGTHDIHHICWHNPPPATDSLLVNAVLLMGLMLPIGAMLGGLRDRQRAGRLLTRLGGSSGTGDDVREIESDRVVAATLGWWSPVTVVSEGLRRAVTEAEWDAIVAHEKAHAARRDGLRAALFSVCTSVLLPASARQLRRQRQLAVEQLCDRYAAQKVDRWTAANALISFTRSCRRGEQSDSMVQLGTGMSSFGEGNLTRRVESLVGEEKQAEGGTAAYAPAIVAACCLAGSLSVSPWVHPVVDTLLNQLL